MPIFMIQLNIEALRIDQRPDMKAGDWLHEVSGPPFSTAQAQMSADDERTSFTLQVHQQTHDSDLVLDLEFL